MAIPENIQHIENQLLGKNIKLVAVTKTKPIELLMEAYNAGFKRFGENYVQELVDKHAAMPQDIEWHFIGHLQTNKVKYIAPFVSLIHSVDSLKLLQEINKQAQKNNRIIDCLLQIYIAQEETKMGMNETELHNLLISSELANLKNIRIIGLMGMATFTENQNQIRQEFRNLKEIFEKVRSQQSEIRSQKLNFTFPISDSSLLTSNFQLKELSMGMSSDYQIAIEEGSTMIRVGSAIFGARVYPA